MAGSALPYALRQNKYVDRRIFIDALNRIERYAPLDDYVYISMGGASLEDHALAHSQLGITRLISIDAEEWVKDRQVFNNPFSCVRPIVARSGELIANLQPILKNEGFDPGSSIVTWLDYTSPSQINQQLNEVRALLAKMQPLDVLRVTINADPDGLYQPARGGAYGPETRENFAPKRYEKLATRLAEYLPRDTSSDDTDRDTLAPVLAKALATACLKAYPGSSPYTALPLSLIRYADGQQMLSVTMIIIKKTDVTQFLDKIRAQAWPYFSPTWADIHKIAIPYLTIRERMLLSANVAQVDTAEIGGKLGFLFENDEEKTAEIISEYSKYYRFYPQFHHVPL